MRSLGTGVEFADVERIFLTHWHGDHTGLAGEIQAEVYVHEDDAPLVVGDPDAWAEMFGELEGIHILQGPGESHAHLEHSERAGTVVRERDDRDRRDGVQNREIVSNTPTSRGERPNASRRIGVGTKGA